MTLAAAVFVHGNFGGIYFAVLVACGGFTISLVLLIMHLFHLVQLTDIDFPRAVDLPFPFW